MVVICRHVAFALGTITLWACNSAGEPVVEARDACFAVAKAVDDVTLTTSALQVDIDRTINHKFTMTWPEAQHGATYVCVSDVSDRKITSFTKNGMPLLDTAPAALKVF